MRLRTIILAGASAFALSSCVTPPAQLTAESLLIEPYQARTAEFDVAAFFEAMPGWLDVTFAEASFDPASGAMVVRDVVFSPVDAPAFRLRADRADIWGGDAAAVTSLMSGADGVHALFDRIALTGVRAEGLQWQNGAQSAHLSFDKIVYDGLRGRHIALAEKPGAEGPAQFLRQMAAISSGYAIDGAAYSNLTARFNESQGNEVSFSIEEGFVRGYDGGRTDYERVEGMEITTRVSSNNVFREVANRLEGAGEEKPENKILQPWARETFEKAIQNPIALIAASSGGQSSRQRIEMLESRNSDISGALSWLAAWELPPITQTELIDLGSMVMEGYSEEWDGRLIQSLDRSELLSADFYWLIPAAIETRDTGYFLDVMGALDSSAMLYGLGMNADTGSQEIEQFREVVTALGMETIRADSNFGWFWDGATGALNTGYAVDVLDIARSTFGVDLAGPNLAEWDAMVRNPTPVNDLPARIGLNNLNMSLTDDQLLDRIFAYVAAEQGGTPEDLRIAVPAMIRLSGADAAQMNPRIPAYLNAVANFIESGGTLTLDASPDVTVMFDALQQAGQNAPQTVPDLLNLSIVHTPE